MINQIIQEKYIVLLKEDTQMQILTRGGFKRCKDSCDLRYSEIRIFNNPSEAKAYVEPRYRTGYEIVKVMVSIDFLECEENEI